MTIHAVDEAVFCAQAMHSGGLRVVEITLRTHVALEAVKAIRRSVPELCLGVGTVWTETQAQQALDIGADFIVSPGIADEVGTVCRSADVPYLPGAQTVSEIAYLLSQGWRQIKLFPVSVMGGPAAIKAYASVFPEAYFCPTGGITEKTAPDYLKLPSVPCVGGSWVPNPEVENHGISRESAIRKTAERAAALGS